MKDILVHVNVSRHCRTRLDVAARLAKTFDAHLTGLYTSSVGDVAFFMMEEVGTDVEPTMRAWWLQMRDKAKAEFDACLRDNGIKADWIEIEDDVASTVPYRARYADLAVVGQIDPEELLPRHEYEIPERVALDSGGAALVVPYAGSFPTLGQRVLIAWDGSAPAARAVRESFPILQRAQGVDILTLNPGNLRHTADSKPGAALAAYLSRHGIGAATHELDARDIEAGEMILSQAADLGADLIVMGAYGHMRARELILGGATHTLFKKMTVPILMAH